MDSSVCLTLVRECIHFRGTVNSSVLLIRVRECLLLSNGTLACEQVFVLEWVAYTHVVDLLGLTQTSLRALAMFKLPLVPDAELAEIHAAFVTKSRVDVVSMKDRALELLLQHGGADADVQLKSCRVFAHPANRDSEILSAPRAHSRMAKVVKSGFSSRIAANDAVCFEDNPVRKVIARKAEELTCMSDKFAKYDAANVGFGSVGSSHFNHSLECANQGVPCDLEEISEGGRMSRNKVEQKEPGLKIAFEKGLKWTTVRWEIEAQYPHLPSLFQSALNSTQQIAEGHVT